MPLPLDRRSFRPFFGRAAFGLALLLAVVFLAGSALAQDDEVAAAREARAALEERFEVIDLSIGWVLRPRDGRDDFAKLEILEGRILVDGVEIEEEDALRRFVDEDAERVLVLAEVSPDRLAGTPAAPEPPDAPDAPAIDEDAVDDARAAAREEAREERRRERRERRGDDARVSFGTSLRIEEDEAVREVVLIVGDLEVLGDIDGDATVVGGSAEVEGRVDGSLVVVGGSIRLGSDAVIDGDAVAVGGGIHREPGAVIDGEVVQVNFGDSFDFGDVHIGTPGWPSPGDFFSGSWWDFVGNVFGILFLLLLLVPFVFVAPGRTRAVGERARREPWKAGLVGVVIEVLFLPLLLLVFVVLMVSIVGIPLVLVVIPLLVLGLALYFLMGLAGVSIELGQWVDRRFRWNTLSPYLLLVLGVVLVQCWALLGEVLSFLPWPIRVSAILLVFLGLLAEYVAWTVGLGAAVLHQFSPLPEGPAYAFLDPHQEPPRDPNAPPAPSSPPEGDEA